MILRHLFEQILPISAEDPTKWGLLRGFDAMVGAAMAVACWQFFGSATYAGFFAFFAVAGYVYRRQHVRQWVLGAPPVEGPIYDAVKAPHYWRDYIKGVPLKNDHPPARFVIGARVVDHYGRTGWIEAIYADYWAAVNASVVLSDWWRLQERPVSRLDQPFYALVLDGSGGVLVGDAEVEAAKTAAKE